MSYSSVFFFKTLTLENVKPINMLTMISKFKCWIWKKKKTSLKIDKNILWLVPHWRHRIINELQNDYLFNRCKRSIGAFNYFSNFSPHFCRQLKLMWVRVFERVFVWSNERMTMSMTRKMQSKLIIDRGKIKRPYHHFVGHIIL